ncbi:MAG: hypothetical protein BWY19_00654 [bacterium ADurb.Bin212]|nr:MAG: hypothetical protein BWY19_00654 [bacterium ADurb.Bin212]
MKKLSFKISGWFGARFEIFDEDGKVLVESLSSYIVWPWSNKFSLKIYDRVYLFKMGFPDQRKWSIRDEQGDIIAELCSFIITRKRMARIHLGKKSLNIEYVYDQNASYLEILFDDHKYRVRSTAKTNLSYGREGIISCDKKVLTFEDCIVVFCGVFSMIKNDFI